VAELGSALLDANEEISKQREELVVEYSHKLEVLEQEKYQLRRKLELLEDDYQQQFFELNRDMSSIRRYLDKQAQRRKDFERQSSNTIQQLTEENQRLSTHVKRVGEKEKHLVSHRQAINTDIALKKTSMQKHLNSMEKHNKRISQLVLDNIMIEKQIKVLTKEIGSMTLAVEHSANKIWHMERKTTNQEKVNRNYEKDREKLRSTNQYLSERLKKVSRYKKQESKQATNLLLEIERSVLNIMSSLLSTIVFNKEGKWYATQIKSYPQRT
jgi:coiled-coil domain-containing protein 64